ncbi:MAG: type II toxin-antitoxin system RelE/ParE family toxin [Bacteroidota bacterium]
MEIKVFWTETALKNLEDIFEYHKYNASVRVAKKLVKEIVVSTIKIQNSPNIGKKEELLAIRKFEYRFLVVGKHKIIYWIEDNYIKIAAVFDCRQNPEKIKNV